MRHRPTRALAEIDIEVPSVARMHGYYYLGGTRRCGAGRGQGNAHWPGPPAAEVFKARRAVTYQVQHQLLTALAGDLDQ
jgi:hypothetical protein